MGRKVNAYGFRLGISRDWVIDIVSRDKSLFLFYSKLLGSVEGYISIVMKCVNSKFDFLFLLSELKLTRLGAYYEVKLNVYDKVYFVDRMLGGYYIRFLRKLTAYSSLIIKAQQNKLLNRLHGGNLEEKEEVDLVAISNKKGVRNFKGHRGKKDFWRRKKSLGSRFLFKGVRRFESLCIANSNPYLKGKLSLNILRTILKKKLEEIGVKYSINLHSREFFYIDPIYTKDYEYCEFKPYFKGNTSEGPFGVTINALSSSLDKRGAQFTDLKFGLYHRYFPRTRFLFFIKSRTRRRILRRAIYYSDRDRRSLNKKFWHNSKIDRFNAYLNTLICTNFFSNGNNFYLRKYSKAAFNSRLRFNVLRLKSKKEFKLVNNNKMRRFFIKGYSRNLSEAKFLEGYYVSEYYQTKGQFEVKRKTNCFNLLMKKHGFATSNSSSKGHFLRNRNNFQDSKKHVGDQVKFTKYNNKESRLKDQRSFKGVQQGQVKFAKENRLKDRRSNNWDRKDRQVRSKFSSLYGKSRNGFQDRRGVKNTGKFRVVTKSKRKENPYLIRRQLLEKFRQNLVIRKEKGQIALDQFSRKGIKAQQSKPSFKYLPRKDNIKFNNKFKNRNDFLKFKRHAYIRSLKEKESIKDIEFKYIAGLSRVKVSRILLNRLKREKLVYKVYRGRRNYKGKGNYKGKRRFIRFRNLTDKLLYQRNKIRRFLSVNRVRANITSKGGSLGKSTTWRKVRYRRNLQRYLLNKFSKRKVVRRETSKFPFNYSSSKFFKRKRFGYYFRDRFCFNSKKVTELARSRVIYNILHKLMKSNSFEMQNIIKYNWFLKEFTYSSPWDMRHFRMKVHLFGINLRYIYFTLLKVRKRMMYSYLYRYIIANNLVSELNHVFKRSNFIVSLVGLGISELSSFAFASYICFRLEFHELLGAIVYPLLRSLYKYKQIIGIRVKGSGRFTRKERASKRMIKEGLMPLSTVVANIDYGFSEACLKYGICGIKVWIYRKDEGRV